MQGIDPKSQTTKKLQTKEKPLAKKIPTTEKTPTMEKNQTTQRIRIKKKNRTTKKPLRSCNPKTSAPSSNSIWCFIGPLYSPRTLSGPTKAPLWLLMISNNSFPVGFRIDHHV
ncbi:hypothetical protein B9Z55_027110 [Caenorhabditis nigoni]|uniref:Uncharacterized protein n=1 Tax=Caenorhabditis nigoni TaxID=1611254 RepID=A0A2G5SIY8_9PELO|nr:hypothetical protein B9Z55_027110 [Caenorhabditis nigoni]